MRIATVGHSTHSIDHFLSMLSSNLVTAIADVRSSPFSRHNPQFNREPLKVALKDAGVGYVFLGRELGARSDDPADYRNGRVSYPKLAASDRFRSGIERVVTGATSHRVALMCAEKDPVTCHRTILVARALIGQGADVDHILADGAVETHDAALERLMVMLGINPNDMFAAPEELRTRAYAEQEARIAYTLPDEGAAA